MLPYGLLADDASHLCRRVITRNCLGGWETRMTRAIRGARPFGPSSTSFRCSKSAILPILSNPRVRSSLKQQKQEAHREGGLLVSVGWETRMTSYILVLSPSGHFRLRRKCSLLAILPKVSNLLVRF